MMLWEQYKWNGRYGDGGYQKTNRPGRPAELLKGRTFPCAFCRGGGTVPNSSAQCPVCRGRGEVEVKPPAVRCGYCSGRGDEKPNSRITCTVCKGKGAVHVEEPIKTCFHCRGAGKEPNNKLTCLKCGGKGVISGRSRTGSLRVSASEREVLEVFMAAKESRRPMNVSDYTGFSPSYVDMMIRSLVGEGLLAPIGARQYRITDEGEELLKKKPFQEQGEASPKEGQTQETVHEPSAPEPERERWDTITVRF